MKRKRIIAVASIGGHWGQLLRIAQPLENRYDVVYMSTHEKCKTMIGPNRFYKLPDFNRSNAWKMLASVFKVIGVLLKERPAAVLTTGAAPGLLTIVVAKFLFRNTIWIDSVANTAEELKALLVDPNLKPLHKLDKFASQSLIDEMCKVIG